MSQRFGMNLMMAGVSKPWLGPEIGRWVSALEAGPGAAPRLPAREVVAWLGWCIADLPPRLPAPRPQPPKRAG